MLASQTATGTDAGLHQKPSHLIAVHCWPGIVATRKCGYEFPQSVEEDSAVSSYIFILITNSRCSNLITSTRPIRAINDSSVANLIGHRTIRSNRCIADLVIGSAIVSHRCVSNTVVA